MRNILDILVAKHRDLLSLYLQDDDWDKLKVMIDILCPIFDATEILSSSIYPTISDVRLTIFGLIRHLDLFLEDSCSNDISLLIENINLKLKEYIEESTTISTLLDPRLKTKTFISTEQYKKTINILQNQMKNYNNNQQNHAVSNTKKNKYLFFESLLTEQSSSPSIKDEITRYITVPVVCDTNLLDWWCHYKDDFLVLATMASCYLSIQGSSVLVEQAFSIAANVITKIYCNLKPELACAIMHLKS
ncbi:6978_t:CDS:2 [Cetraspora pellucida]|uniref:6978_t:CDS:1 n=1 Tax=Cetraspora pellucida TaxID=1433469 RepID=A0A9N9BH72_9GLOM|nr:6978_t:CDS:2 [Cetraspora pellucida]